MLKMMGIPFHPSFCQDWVALGFKNRNLDLPAVVESSDTDTALVLFFGHRNSFSTKNTNGSHDPRPVNQREGTI